VAVWLESNVSGKSHPGEGDVVEKQVKKPSSGVVDKSFGTSSKNEVSKEPPSLSLGSISLPDDPKVHFLCYCK